MCGICGAIGIQNVEASESMVRRMLGSMVHRGPDEEGFLSAFPVAIGSRRLSVIDLPGGSQPLWNETHTMAVVFNGEVYNFCELRNELASRGHRFRTRSDTEVIIHAYEAWGEKCLERLRGMFAFAIVEMPEGVKGRASRVFIARDRIGIKPLYYAIVDGALLFASEVRSLLASGRVIRQLCSESLSCYLLFGSVGEPMTLVERIFSLPPGHFLSIALDGERIASVEPRPYWCSAAFQAERSRASRSAVESPAREVRSLLEDAVRSHLIADVPLGVFLSSGIDSSAVAALAARAQKKVHTFTVAFPDAEFSESRIASATAKHLGSEHQELSLASDEMLARLDQAISALDQPSMDGVNTYFVSWAARQAGLKVALSGLGADELFGGYTSFESASKIGRISKLARAFPGRFRKVAADVLEKTKPARYSPDAFRKALAAWRDPESLAHPYFFSRALFTPEIVLSHLRQNSRAWNGTPWGRWLSQAATESGSLDDFTAVSWLEMRSYLVNTLLRDTDSMSMSHSLEVRVPFLDAPLAEFAMSLPQSVKMKSGQPKSLLIQALGDLLPPEVLRQRKRTFTFPWDNWFDGPLGDRVASGFANWSPKLEPHLSGEFARKVWKEFRQRRTSWSRPWSLFVLNEWVKRNLQFEPAPASVSGRRTAEDCTLA